MRRAIAIVLTTLVLVACKTETPAKAKAPPTVRERPVFVKLGPLKRGSVEQRLGFVGELAAEESVELAAKLSGRIRSIKVRMGDETKKGDLLVAIEDSQLRAQLSEARASLSVARAAIERAEVLEKNAASEVSRKERLVEKDLVTDQEMDNLRFRQASETAALALANAQASQAEARIQLLETQLKDAKIRAPFAGRVAARHLDPGAVVSPGTAIMQIIDADPIIARFKVPERYLGVITEAGMNGDGFEVQVRLDAFPGTVFPGKVARISPALDKTTRSAVVEAEVQNPSGKVAPGMYCRVELDLGRREDALLLPAEALLDNAKQAAAAKGAANTPLQGKVYVVRNGRAHQQKVTLGAKSDGYFEIIDGLDDGAKVVIEGASLLKEGAKVKILETSGEAPRPDGPGARK